jgi:hypothetical protein
MLHALTMLNEAGDTTIAWTPDRDEEMEAIIAKKMKEGCAFFIIEDRGLRMPLTDPADATKTRHLAIPDADFLRFVETAPPGTAAAVTTPKAPAKRPRQTKDPKEAARSQTVGVRQRTGG